MSTLQEFLIKSAGMEKKAKRALLRALEKGIDIADHNIRYPNAMSAVDLKTPLIKRIANTISGSGGSPITEAETRSYISTLDRTQKIDLLRRMTDDGMSNATQEHSKRFSTKPYFTSMLSSNPQLGKASKIYKKFLEPKPKEGLSYKQQELADILIPTHRSLFQRFAELADDVSQVSAIPTISVYESKVPFASTHHLADERIGLAANIRAREAVAADPTIRHITNLDPNRGWNNWRSDIFETNIPGRPWTEDRLKLMQDGKNLSPTPIYESVFTRGAKDYPRLTDVYVPDTEDIRKILGIPDDVKSVHIDELQSPVQGILYKGKRDGSGFISNLIDYYKNHPLDIRRAQALTGFKLNRISQASLADTKARWFAPAARTARGYAAAPRKLIRLSGDQISKLRNHTPAKQDMEKYVKELQETIDNADPHDLQRAITSVLEDRKLDRDVIRISNIVKTLSSRLNLPENVIRDILLA